MTRKFLDMIKAVIVAASKLVDKHHIVLSDESDYGVVQKELVEELRTALVAFHKVVEKEVELPDEDKTVAVDEKGGLYVPKNVHMALKQVYGYGINLSDYKAVLAELRSLGDFDVVRWIIRNQEEYKKIYPLLMV